MEHYKFLGQIVENNIEYIMQIIYIVGPIIINLANVFIYIWEGFAKYI